MTRSAADPFESEIHEQLRLRSRDEDVGSHRQIEPVELAPTQDVGDRLACASATEQRSGPLDGREIKRVVDVAHQPGPLHSERVRDEEPRLVRGQPARLD